MQSNPSRKAEHKTIKHKNRPKSMKRFGLELLMSYSLKRNLKLLKWYISDKARKQAKKKFTRERYIEKVKEVERDK